MHAGDIDTAIQRLNDLNPEILETNPLLLFRFPLPLLTLALRQGSLLPCRLLIHLPRALPVVDRPPLVLSCLTSLLTLPCLLVHLRPLSLVFPLSRDGFPPPWHVGHRIKQQRLIELIRAGSVKDAVEFVQVSSERVRGHREMSVMTYEVSSETYVNDISSA